MNYDLLYHDFYSEVMISIGFKYEGIEDCLTVEASVKDFDKFTPNIEGKLTNDEGDYTARFDKFGNLHWLIELDSGHINYRSVNCNNLIEEMIYEKWKS